MIAPLKVSTSHIATTFSYHLDAAEHSFRRKIRGASCVHREPRPGLHRAVSYGFFGPESTPFGPFNPSGLANKVFYAGTRFLGTADATTSVALATVTQIPSGSNTGTFSGNMGFWNSTTNQNSGVLTGNYTTDTLTTRVTGTTNILGAASFAVYQISTNQFVLIGTASSDTGAVLIVF
jgi:hypothetical protein